MQLAGIFNRDPPHFVHIGLLLLPIGTICVLIGFSLVCSLLDRMGWNTMTNLLTVLPLLLALLAVGIAIDYKYVRPVNIGRVRIVSFAFAWLSCACIALAVSLAGAFAFKALFGF